MIVPTKIGKKLKNCTRHPLFSLFSATQRALRADGSSPTPFYCSQMPFLRLLAFRASSLLGHAIGEIKAPCAPNKRLRRGGSPLVLADNELAILEKVLISRVIF